MKAAGRRQRIEAGELVIWLWRRRNSNMTANGRQRCFAVAFLLPAHAVRQGNVLLYLDERIVSCVQVENSVAFWRPWAVVAGDGWAPSIIDGISSPAMAFSSLWDLPAVCGVSCGGGERSTTMRGQHRIFWRRILHEPAAGPSPHPHPTFVPSQPLPFTCTALFFACGIDNQATLLAASHVILPYRIAALNAKIADDIGSLM
jgi:hypothetical protein